MKKIICIIVSISLFFVLIVPAYADYKYPVVQQDLLPENIIINIIGKHEHTVLNVDCRNGSLDTSAISWISYDTLSGISVDLTSLGQVVYNSANDAYFISVPYTDTLGTRHYGTLGSASGGYVYGTHANRSGGGGSSTTSHKVTRIGSTSYYWIDTTALASCEYHYVSQSSFDGIMSTCRGAVGGGAAVVRESVLLSGTPCYVLKMYQNGTWVGTVCDQYGPIYCSTVNGGTIVVDTGDGESGSGATFDDTDVLNAIDSVFRAISSVDDSISYVSTYLSRLNNNFINFANDFKLNYEMQGNDLSNIYSILLAMYQSFYDRFSDLDLTYYNDAEIQLYNGEYLDWSESDRGQISIEANDIGTLELLGFPDMDGYKATHSFGGDITIQRNDGTFFPDRWELPGGTVSMPAIESAYSSITVTAPVGTVITVAGNTHTFENANPYSVNVAFGSYTIEASYEDGSNTATKSYTVDVDGYNDYAVTFTYIPGGFTVTVNATSHNEVGDFRRSIKINGQTLSADTLTSSVRTFQLNVGDVIKFDSNSSYSSYLYVDGVQISKTPYTYTVTSDCSITYTVNPTYRWNVVTSPSSVFGDFDSPTVTISANDVTSVPVTIERLVRLSGGDWVAYDILGNSYSFSPVSELALNRSFVTHIYTADEIADLNNFPSGYWQVSWSGESHYITIKFEEYSKFFLWLNRFLINFRDTLFMKMQDISVTADGDVIITSSDYTEQLNMIIEKLDSVQDFDINISADNDSYNVFFVDGGEDGTQDDESIVDLSKDSLNIMGRLMNFLYQIMFKDSIANGGGMDDIIDFYTDTSQEVGDPWVA